MTMLKGIMVTLICTLIVLTTPQIAAAQHYDENVEIAVLGTVAIFMPDRGREETTVSIPGGSSVVPGSAGLRVAFHNLPPYLLEVGATFQHTDALTVTTAEVALGGSYGQRGTTPQPFVQGVVGILNTTNGAGDTEMYLGGQGGLRYFFRPTVGLRMQVGYRTMIGNRFDFSVFEFGMGIGIMI